MNFCPMPFRIVHADSNVCCSDFLKKETKNNNKKKHGNDYVVLQFYPWFKFSFLLFQTHYHTLPYPKTKEKKIKPRIKLNHNNYRNWKINDGLQLERREIYFLFIISSPLAFSINYSKLAWYTGCLRCYWATCCGQGDGKKIMFKGGHLFEQ